MSPPLSFAAIEGLLKMKESMKNMMNMKSFKNTAMFDAEKGLSNAMKCFIFWV